MIENTRYTFTAPSVIFYLNVCFYVFGRINSGGRKLYLAVVEEEIRWQSSGVFGILLLAVEYMSSEMYAHEQQRK
jgi:hypothetical protein